MRRESKAFFRIAAGMLIAGAVHVAAQAPTPAPAPGGRGANKQAAAPARGGGGGAYPQRTPDPAAVARGKAVYDINCALCHGEDARGGDNGPNLIRGEVVMNDQNGERIGPVLQTGRAAEGMPKFDFTAAQVSDISAFLHSFRVGGYDISQKSPAQHRGGRCEGRRVVFQRQVRVLPFGNRRSEGHRHENRGCPDAAATMADAGGRRARRRAGNTSHGHGDAAF